MFDGLHTKQNWKGKQSVMFKILEVFFFGEKLRRGFV